MIGEDPEKCPFCNIEERKNEIIYRGESVSAILPDEQVRRVHVLIIPNEHVRKLVELDDETCLEMFHLLSRVVNILEEKFDIDGYNVAINQGKFAGQKVRHLHIHIIARIEGDLEDPEKWLNPEIV
ncbi:MAG: HIT family protein, partial [Candidatus Aenigmatarchaeota archaeon]